MSLIHRLAVKRFDFAGAGFAQVMVDAFEDLPGLALDVLAGVGGGQAGEIDPVAVHDGAAHARPRRLGDVDAADVGHGFPPVCDLDGSVAWRAGMGSAQEATAGSL